MFVRSIYIRNFRNIHEIKTDFSDCHNILTGNNGEGKTNILEAVFFSCMQKSFRTRVVSDLKDNREEKDIYTRCSVEYGNFSRVIENTLCGRKKTLKVDDIEENPEYLIENNFFVTFIPDDLRILKNDPVYRRKFLNEVCSQIYPNYYNDLLKYRKIINHRNFLLKEKRPFDLWDELLIGYASSILEKRKECMEFLQNTIPESYSMLSSGNERISLEYKGDFDISPEKLKKSRENDKKNGYTCIGPHRDDIIIKIDDHDFRKTASQGQFRTAVFSLKMAQAEILWKVRKEKPVIILDDVFSELDRTRKQRFLEFLEGNFQTFISSNYIEEGILEKMKEKKIFCVREGKIEEQRVFKSM